MDKLIDDIKIGSFEEVANTVFIADMFSKDYCQKILDEFDNEDKWNIAKISTRNKINKIQLILKYETKLLLKNYSRRTIEVYLSGLSIFIKYIQENDIDTVTYDATPS